MALRQSAAFTVMLLWVGLVATGCPAPTRYQTGFTDGCDAGTAIATSYFERPDSYEPADNDADYLIGWQDGFDVCRKSPYWRRNRDR